MSAASGTTASLPARPDVPAARRIATLDILRGLALVGMILVHCHVALGGGQGSLAENPIGWGIATAVADKSRTIFALLFGVSFAVMLRRLEAKNLPVVPIFLRRLFVLYVIGFAVEVVTQFSILREYAWWGLALLFLRALPTRTLLWLAVICAAAVSIRDLADTAYAAIRTGLDATRAAQAAQQQQWDTVQQADGTLLASTHWGTVAAARAKIILRDTLSIYSFTPNSYLALFILGLLAVRHGVFDAPRDHLRLIVGAMTVGLAGWIAATWLLPLIPADFVTPRIASRLRDGLGLLDGQLLAFSYAGGLLLMLTYRPEIQSRLSWVASAGQIALTNYILQAVVIDLASAAYGLKLQLAPRVALCFALILSGLLLLLSRLWLRFFRFGPFEWAWRSLTYRRKEPLRLKPVPDTA